jgi:hypothetical protein
MKSSWLCQVAGYLRITFADKHLVIAAIEDDLPLKQRSISH